MDQYFKSQGVEVNIPEKVISQEGVQRKRILTIPEDYHKKLENRKKGYPKNKKLNDKDEKEFPVLA